MKRDIALKSLKDNRSPSESVELACNCPICGIALIPKVISGTLIGDVDDESEDVKAFLLNYCPHCNECFISRHIYDECKDNYSFHSSSPVKYTGQYFSKNIRELSPKFVTIYNDSLCAEKSGLLSICGMGYRKSLEFL